MHDVVEKRAFGPELAHADGQSHALQFGTQRQSRLKALPHCARHIE